MKHDAEIADGERHGREFYDDSLIDFHLMLKKLGGVKGRAVPIGRQDIVINNLDEIATLRGYLGVCDKRHSLSAEGIYGVERTYPGWVKLVCGGRCCFELRPNTMYLYHADTATESIVVVTNHPSTKLTLDELAMARPVIAKTAQEELITIAHHFDPILIYPAGSRYFISEHKPRLPFKLERVIAREAQKCLNEPEPQT